MKSDRSVEQLPCNREDPTARKCDRSSQWIRQNSNAIVTGSWVHLRGFPFSLSFHEKIILPMIFHTLHITTHLLMCVVSEKTYERKRGFPLYHLFHSRSLQRHHQSCIKHWDSLSLPVWDVMSCVNWMGWERKVTQREKGKWEERWVEKRVLTCFYLTPSI